MACFKRGRHRLRVKRQRVDSPGLDVKKEDDVKVENTFDFSAAAAHADVLASAGVTMRRGDLASASAQPMPSVACGDDAAQLQHALLQLLALQAQHASTEGAGTHGGCNAGTATAGQAAIVNGVGGDGTMTAMQQAGTGSGRVWGRSCALACLGGSSRTA